MMRLLSAHPPVPAVNRAWDSPARQPVPSLKAARWTVDVKLGLRFWGPLARSVGGECHEFSLPLAEVGLQVAVAAYLEQSGRTELWNDLLRCAFAVNDQLVGPSHRLLDGDVIDVLPPVSGG